MKSEPAAKKPAPASTKKQASKNGAKAGKNGQAKIVKEAKKKQVSKVDKRGASSPPLPDILKPIKKRRIKAVCQKKPPVKTEEQPADGDEVEVCQSTAASPNTYALGLKVGWWVEFDDGAKVPVHSVRDMANTFQQKGLNCGKVESIRAFIRRRSKGAKMRKKSFVPFAGVKAITRASCMERNLLEGRLDVEEGEEDE